MTKGDAIDEFLDREAGIQKAHRFPGPSIFENVEHLEEGGSGQKLLSRLPCGGPASVLIIRRTKHPQGEILHVCGGRALDDDGVRWTNSRTEVLESSKKRGEEGTVRSADDPETDPNLRCIISTYERGRVGRTKLRRRRGTYTNTRLPGLEFLCRARVVGMN
jgi:hypothetical protein